jgi:predicted ATPase/DNA-binding CsgD family transcriptional regulator
MTATESGFGEQLRRYRIAAGLTQEELAERAGVSARGISDLERGARSLPRKDTLQLLLDALELSPVDRAALAVAARPRPATTARGAYGDTSSGLHVPLTPFIGRETEVAEVSVLVTEPAIRLLTLTGPGGTGKTRLAVAVAGRVGPDFFDGVALVSLAPLGDPVLVASAIAQQLGVREGAGASLTNRLKAHLAEKRMLLVLDNFEHLLPAAPLVIDLLRACSSLHVLATSRAPLHLSGERTYPVPPLELPNPRQLPLLDDLAQIEAVRLFVDRVQAGKPDFALTDANAPAIAEIVHRLDGLPLAIELAAARVPVLSPAALLARLDRRLPLLTGGARDAPERQRTLRDTIAWSHDLLSPKERALFRRLAVFSGGWTLEAAEIVTNRDADLDVFSGLATLVDMSLARSSEQADGEPRFTMLETIRELALEQLEAGEGAEVMRQAHGRYCVDLAERLRPQIEGSEGPAILDRLEAEHGNLRAALTWALERSDAEMLLRLVAALWKFWWVRNYLTEGRAWSERALAVNGDWPALRLEVMYAAASFARRQGDLAHAAALGEEGVGLANARGDNLHAAMLVYLLALVAVDQADLGRARTRAEEALVHFRALPSSHWLASHGIAITLSTLGEVAGRQGDLAVATPALEEALNIWRQRGDAWGMALALTNLADLALRQGETAVATRHYRDGLASYWEVGDKWGIGVCLESLAWLAVHDEPEQATRLLAAAEVVRDEAGNPLGEHHGAHEQAIAIARATLGDERFAAAWSAGGAMPLEQVIAEASAVVTAPPTMTDNTRSHRSDEQGRLSARELEVLRLLAQGHSDQEIADALFVSRRTASTHVANILNKLGLDSRVAAATHAVRHGLVA